MKVTAQIKKQYKKIGKSKFLGIILGTLTGFAIALIIGKKVLVKYYPNITIDPIKEETIQNLLKFDETSNSYKVESKSFDATLPSSEDKNVSIENPNQESIKLNPVNLKSDEIETKEDTIIYKNAYENTDVEYEALENGVKESIILKEPGHPETFKFSTDLSAYDYILQPSGRIKVYRKGHEGNDLFLVFDIPAPYMWDANEERSNEIEVKIVENEIEITPSKEWLKNAIYPVIVDPTVAINVLNVHSHPVEGEYWNVDFTTVGTDDLYIIPADQETIDDMEFSSLTCGEEQVEPQIQENDVIFVPNWSCEDIATVSHYDKKTGNHHLIFKFAGQTAHAYNAAVAWDGGAGTSNWSDAANWNNDAIPTAADDVTIDDNVTVNIGASTTINSLTLGNSGGTTSPTLNFTYNAATAGALIIDNGDLTINGNANITHSANSNVVSYNIYIDVQTGDTTILGSGTINVNGKGYTQANGPGAGGYGNQDDGTGGGAYGGNGGDGESWDNGGEIYGSIETPTQPGSGGGNADCCATGGSGGGYIKLNVAGTLTVNGIITSNGNNGNASSERAAGGGSGGGMLITPGTLTGTGIIRANGGNGGYHDNDANGGGGGGGRIAIKGYTSIDTFSGTLTAQGGEGPNYSDINVYGHAQDGGAGTIYKEASGATHGDLVIDNGTRSGSTENNFDATTPLEDTYTYEELTIKNYANVIVTGTVTATTINLSDYGHLKNQNTANISYTTLNWSNNAIITDNGGTFDIVSGGGDLTIPDTTKLVANESRTFNSVTVHGTLTHSDNGSTLAYQINLSTIADFTVENTGTINVNGRGYLRGYGSGAGATGDQDDGAGGGGYGGNGGEGETGRSGGGAYGSIEAPSQIGSGGGNTDTGWAYGGDGGGLIRLNVGGTLDVSGTIYANGTNGRQDAERASGGGSGGGIYLTATTFNGSGTIGANGGNGGNHDNDANGGGGSGGRIAIDGYSTYNFTGTLSAQGGTGPDYGDINIYGTAEDGGAGTIFKKSSTDTNGHLTIDNGTITGNFENPDMATTPFSDTYNYDSLTITNYANVDVTGNIDATDLTLENNGHINNRESATITYSTLTWRTGADITDNGGTFDIVSGGGDLTVPETTKLIANEPRTFNSVTINGTLTHSDNWSTLVYQINYTTTTDFTVGNTGTINVNGRGYGREQGPGSGSHGNQDDGAGGGGYGGDGGKGETNYAGGNAYGNIETPDQPGSGGGNTDASFAYGGDGGGLIRLNVGGTLDVSGTIYANGTNGRQDAERASGGGSGGGIYITAATINGSGTIGANGGNGGNHTDDAIGGGGGGGRIAIDGYSSYGFSGTLSAQGGVGPDYSDYVIYGDAEDGGAGTIFKKSSTDTNGHLIIDNGTNTGNPETPNMGYTPFDATYTFDTITVSNYASVSVTGTINTTDLTLESNGHINNRPTAVINYSNFTWTSGTISDNGGTFDIVSGGGDLIIPADGKLVENTARTFTSVTVNGTLTHTDNSTVFAHSLNLTTTGNFTVESSGTINVNGRGYRRYSGPGSGGYGDQDDGAGGGGYGGYGGNGDTGRSGGNQYGSIEAPDQPGSGGGNTDAGWAYGGDGGGLVRLNVGGTLEVLGTIYANGTNGRQDAERASGGGSGGGIYITATAFNGSGTIEANGGNGGNHTDDAVGGGGAGGRIAIDGYSTYGYTGTISAQGGTGPDWGDIDRYGDAKDGAAGTIFKKSSTDANGHLTLDNGTLTGNTERGDLALNIFSATYTYDSLTIKNYARTSVTGTLNLTNITIQENGYLDLKSSAEINYSTFDWQSGGTLVDNGGTFDIISGGGTLTIPVETTLVSNVARSYSAVIVNGTLTHTKNSSIFTNNINMDVSGDFSISGSGSINIDGRGFSASYGNGAGTDGDANDGGGGGGYGGIGGNGESGRSGGPTYSEEEAPTLPGSGGGHGGGSGIPGGYGGGYLKLDIDGILEIIGVISANGNNAKGVCNAYAGGGGSGGGLYITARDVEGTGTIRANGGNGYNCGDADGGGGAGGRIAIYYNGSYEFTGNTYVNGGNGPDSATDGAEGTTHIQQTNILPVVTAPYDIEQATDGSGFVYFTVSVNDENGEDTKLKFEYSDDDGTTWYDPYIEAKTVSEGTANLNNTEEYQIGEIDRIDTSAGAINITVTWATKSASNGGGSLDGTDQEDIRLRVRPHDGISEGRTQTTIAFAIDNLAPSGLADLTLSNLTSDSATLTWDSVTEEEFDHFEVWYGSDETAVENRNSDTAAEWDEDDDTNLSTLGTTTTTVTSIDSETNYYWKLWAIDAYGNEGTTPTLLQTLANLGQFNPDCLVEKEVGEGIEGQSGCFKAQVADTDASDNLYIEIEVKEVGVAFDETGTVTSDPAVAYSGTPVTIDVTATGLSIGTDYHWRIRSRDDAGTTSDWVSFGGNAEGIADFTATVPAPTTVTSSYVADTEITINWDDPSDLEDGYVVERSTNEGAFSQIADLPAGTITFTDNSTNNPGTPPTANAKYVYRVKATYTTFESTPREADTPTYTTPAAPSELSIEQTGMGTITLTWTDNSGYEEYFEVQRKIGSDSFETLTSTVAAEATTYNDTNVREESSYQYRILAIRTTPDPLSSAYSESSTVSITTGGGKGIYITSTGRLIAQNNFNKEINVWDKIQDDSTEQIGEDVFYDENNPSGGPVLSEETNINDIYVKEGGSLVDGRSDIIYLATDIGIMAIHEKGLEPSEGAVKYYTNEYITDLMIGDIKAMWTLHDDANSTTVTDTSTNSNNLTASTNTANITSAGVRGKGWTLNGDYASSLDDDNLDFADTDNFSITTWFKHSTISTSPEYLVAKHQSGVAGGYKIWMDSGGDICFGIDDDGTWDPDDSACTENVDYDDEEWHQLTAVKIGTSKIELFIDGDSVAEDADLEATGTLENGADFYLGIDSDGTSNHWNGSIDEISITADALTDNQIKIMYEIGNRATRNHTEGRIEGVSGADVYQKLLGAGTNGATVNKVTTIDGDVGGQYLYVGTNDSSGNTGGLAIIGVMSDSVVDLYTENNTTKLDDNDNSYSGNDIIAVTVIGIPTPDYRDSEDASGVGGIIAIISDNDSTTRLWIEGQSYSLARTIAALTSTSGGSGGTQMQITNTQNPYFTNSDLGLESVFSVDTKGNIVHNYYGVDRDTTAIKFSDPVLTTGTTMQIIGSELTTGKLLDLDADNLTTGNGLSLISSSENLAGSLADIQITGSGATGNAMNLASSATGDDNRVLNIAQTGGTTGTDYGAYISNTGEGDTNVGLFVTASEATNNYAAIFESGYIGIGTTTPTSLLTISGLESSTGTQLVVDASGNVYKDSSSRRYKENIEDFSIDPRELLGLKPVEFYYKDTGAHSFGYIAEEVDELGLNNLVMYDEEGQPDALRYDKLSIYLVEGYKEHEKELNILQELLGIKESTESTESSESTSSTSLAGLTESISTMEQIYSDFKQFVASVGLSLNEETETLVAENNFTVLGETTLSDTTITGNLSIGLMNVDSVENAINIKGPSCYSEITGDMNTEICEIQTLYLQKNLAGNVDVFNGKIILKPNGEIVTNDVLAETYKGIENENIGRTIIHAGEKEVFVENPAIKEKSRIFITPHRPVSVALVNIEENEGFYLGTENKITEDLIIDWWIVEVEE